MGEVNEQRRRRNLYLQPGLSSSLAGKGRHPVRWPWLELGGSGRPCVLAVGTEAGRAAARTMLGASWLCSKCHTRRWECPAHTSSPTPPRASVSWCGRRGWTTALLGLLSTLKLDCPDGSSYAIGRILN